MLLVLIIGSCIKNCYFPRDSHSNQVVVLLKSSKKVRSNSRPYWSINFISLGIFLEIIIVNRLKENYNERTSKSHMHCFYWYQLLPSFHR